MTHPLFVIGRHFRKAVEQAADNLVTLTLPSGRVLGSLDAETAGRIARRTVARERWTAHRWSESPAAKPAAKPPAKPAKPASAAPAKPLATATPRVTSKDALVPKPPVKPAAANPGAPATPVKKEAPVG